MVFLLPRIDQLAGELSPMPRKFLKKTAIRSYKYCSQRLFIELVVSLEHCFRIIVALWSLKIDSLSRLKQ